MVELLNKNSTVWAIRVVGMLFLIAYLAIYQDFSFSLIWAFLHVAIVFGVATGIAGLGIHRLIPSLNTYHMQKKMEESGAEYPESGYDQYQKREEYMKSLFDKKSVAFITAEDGLICVPVILSGISPVSALIAGIVYGGMHLNRFTYFECLIKGVTYLLICLVVLPNGILTVVAGHYLADGLLWLGFKIRKT